MSFVNISAYKFVELPDAGEMQPALKALCSQLNLNGTIILSVADGINQNLVGTRADIDAYIAYIKADPRLADIEFKQSYTKTRPFSKMKVKLKPEIITIRQPDINPIKETVPHLEPKQLKQWLDEGREVVMLDTRNDYEIEHGKFIDAIELNIEHFTHFPSACDQLDPGLKDKTIVMYCTGGVRCEKAGPELKKHGFNDVYQLHGGILKYFEECGGDHYQGNCFVFDDRVAVDPYLQETLI